MDTITVITTDGEEHVFEDGDHHARDDYGNVFIYDEDDNTLAEFSKELFGYIK